MPKTNIELCRFLGDSAECMHPAQDGPHEDTPNCGWGGDCNPVLRHLQRLDYQESASDKALKLLQAAAGEVRTKCQYYEPSEGKADQILDFYRNLYNPATTLRWSLIHGHVPPFAFVRLLDLPPGKTIQMDLGKYPVFPVNFDSFAGRLSAEVVRERGDHKIDPHTWSKTALSGFVERYFTRQRFNGKYDNLRVVILPPDEKIIPAGDRERVIPGSAHSYMTLVDLHSTGKPNFGSLVVESTLFQKNDVKRYNGYEAYIATAHRVIKDQDGLSAVERLMENSRNNEWIAQVEALRKMCSGGLMSLGKRR